MEEYFRKMFPSGLVPQRNKPFDVKKAVSNNALA